MSTARLLTMALLLTLAGPRLCLAQTPSPPAPKAPASTAPTSAALRAQAQHLLDHSQPQAALPLLQRAYQQDKAAKDIGGLASDLRETGNAYLDLSQYAKAIDYYGQALPIYRQTGDRDGEASDLTCTGIAYRNLSQYAKAIDYYGQALPIFRQAGDRDGEAKDLNNTGIAYDDLSQYAKAIDYYGQALPIYRQTGDRDGEASDLMDTGIAYRNLSQYAKAIDFYGQALPIYRQAGDRDGEARDLNNLMVATQSLQQPGAAIFYGKQAVNAYQSIRADLQAKNAGGQQILDAKTQQGYLASVSDTYRRLIDLLIGEGRLPEAEDVLAMLKQQEVTDFVRRDAALTPTALTVFFNHDETTADADYQKYADPVTRLGQQIATLDAQMDALPKGSPQKITLATQKSALQDQLGPAQQAFHTFQADQLPKELPTRPPGQDDPAQLAQQQHGPLQDALAATGPGTVALLTVVEPDKYRVIVVTAKTEKAEEYKIQADALRQLIFQWKQALADPRADPRPLGEQLSKILIGPIAADLIGAKAQTLLWSLDDFLRYVPVAALYAGGRTVGGRYDPAGGHYLVENYRVAVFTGASLPTAAAAPADWAAADPAIAALGVTQKLTVTDPAGGKPLPFPALPGVDTELKAIDQYAGNPGGSLSGAKPLEDGDFSEKNLRIALALKPPVVHIASHFRLGADDKSSFLLLGDGTALTLDALCGQGGQVFQGVDLLTLSACQTAEAGTNGDGHEVESLASVSQSQGASSVLASLWPVSDATTPLLMQAFYRLRAGTPGMSKAEALRQAELSLLRGTLAVPPSAHRATAPDNFPPAADADAPPFVPDPKAPYAHPYYWAPFVLIGNWR